MNARAKSPLPLLVIVRGKPGAGKSTLARRLSEQDALGLPLLSRDAIKAGLVTTSGVETDSVRTRVVPLAFDLFHRTIQMWLREGMSLIAEEAFPRERGEARLLALLQLAHMKIIHCDTADAVAQRRYLARERANPYKRQDVFTDTADQMARGQYPWRFFDAFDLGVPALQVDTTNGYIPSLNAIAAFCQEGHEASVPMRSTRADISTQSD